MEFWPLQDPGKHLAKLGEVGKLGNFPRFPKVRDPFPRLDYPKFGPLNTKQFPKVRERSFPEVRERIFPEVGMRFPKVGEYVSSVEFHCFEFKRWVALHVAL